jgi:hypothetical protein
MMSSTPTRRWFRPTPGRLIAGLFVLEAFLFLSDRFGWFGFRHHKGWAVLIALASALGAVVLLATWTVLALVFRRRLQFTIGSLLAMTVAASLVLSWLATEIKKAREQETAMETITELGGEIDFGDYAEAPWFPSRQAATWPWLIELLGDDLFSNVPGVFLDHLTGASLERMDLTRLTGLRRLTIRRIAINDESMTLLKGANQLERLVFVETKVTDADVACLSGLTGLKALDLSKSDIQGPGLAQLRGLTRLTNLSLKESKITDAGLEHVSGLFQLRDLDLSITEITDAGLRHLEVLSQLRRLNLDFARVSRDGVKRLQNALPNCSISDYGIAPRIPEQYRGQRRKRSEIGSTGDSELDIPPLDGISPLFGRK